MWLRFDDQAKYELAVKIESNGGKVALASPGTYDEYSRRGSAWNREFVVEMFNWIRHNDDTATLRYRPETQPIPSSGEILPSFDEIQTAAVGIEPYLRNRGGLLATEKVADPYHGHTLRPSDVSKVGGCVPVHVCPALGALPG